jgi:hypothetical protein
MSIAIRSPFVALVVFSTLAWHGVQSDLDSLFSTRNLISVGSICLIAVIGIFLAYARKAHDSAKVMAGFIWLFSLGFLVVTISHWTFVLIGLLVMTGLSLGVFANIHPTAWRSEVRSKMSNDMVYRITMLHTH